MGRKISPVFLIVLGLLLTMVGGWRTMQPMRPLRTTMISLKPLQSKIDITSNTQYSSQLFGTRLAESAHHLDHNKYNNNNLSRNPLQWWRRLFHRIKVFGQIISRRFRYLILTCLLSFSIMFGGNLSLVQAKQAAPTEQVQLIAASSSSSSAQARQQQLQRMKELKKNKLQKQQQQQSKGSQQSNKKAPLPSQKPPPAKPAPPATPAKANSNNNNNKINTNNQRAPVAKGAAEKNKSAITKGPPAAGSPTTTEGSIESKELYDKIGLIAVLASLVPLIISFQKEKEDVASLLPKNKSKKTPIAKKAPAAQPSAPSKLIPTSQKVSKVKKVEVAEDDEDEEEDEDEDRIDKETQKTLSVKEYLEKKRQESLQSSTSSELPRNPFLREKAQQQIQQDSAASEVQSFEEFAEENSNIEELVKRGSRVISEAANRSGPIESSDESSKEVQTRIRKTESKSPVKEEESPIIEDIPLPFASVITAPEESIIPEPTIAPTKVGNVKAAETTAPPPPPKKSGNFLTRLFQKPGSGRPSDLRSALVRDKDGTTDLRKIIGTGILQYVPQDLGRKIAKEFPSIVEQFPPESNEQVLENIQTIQAELELSPADTAEIFAEVTNAFVVQLIDRAAAAADELEGAAEGEDSKVIQLLDELTDFMNGVTPLFLAVVKNTASVEPIQYNGKVSRQKLEQLFEYYLKQAQSVQKQSNLLSATQGADGSATSSSSALERGQPSTEELQQLIADRNDRVAKLQFLLSIKENKRTSIEQKLMKEKISKSFGGGGAGGVGGGLGDIFSGFGGGLGGVNGGSGGLGGGFPEFGEKEMTELMKNMKPEDYEEAMKAFGKGSNTKMPEGMPDLSKLKPEEIGQMIQDEVQSLRQSIEAGSITLDDIRALEQQLGTPLESFIATINSEPFSQARGSGALGFSDVIDTFEQLVELKQQMQRK